MSVEFPTSVPDAGRIEIADDAYGVSGPTTDATSAAPDSATYVALRDGGSLFDRQDFAGTHGFEVSKDVAVTVRLVCDREVGSGAVIASSLTAVFAPN